MGNLMRTASCAASVVPWLAAEEVMLRRR